MFTKEKLEKWIETLKSTIRELENTIKHLDRDSEGVVLYFASLTHDISSLNELQHTLEQLYTSINSDGSI
jgi:prefoldin subunit 5